MPAPMPELGLRHAPDLTSNVLPRRSRVERFDQSSRSAQSAACRACEQKAVQSAVRGGVTAKGRDGESVGEEGRVVAGGVPHLLESAIEREAGEGAELEQQRADTRRALLALRIVLWRDALEIDKGAWQLAAAIECRE